MKHKTIGFALIAVAVALVVLVACQSAPVQGPTHVVLDNAYEVGASGDGPAGATSLTDLDLTGNLTVAGAADIAGNPSYGAKDLRPVGNPANGKILMTGMTAGVVPAATVRPTVELITTVTAFGCDARNPTFASNGAWKCVASLGANNQITMTLYTLSTTPVPVATAAYQKIQYWVAGN